jgi:phosphoribosylaminoimidazole-succinocarboxamide synthase
LDAATWEQVHDAALRVFQRGQKISQKTGLILVDTKYEFGRTVDGRVVLIDEVHTPDSSRFWKADSYAARFADGAEPENFDKEFVRMAYAEKGYRGDGEVPGMPASLWAAAGGRYIAIYEMLTGMNFIPGVYPAEPRLLDNLRIARII